MNVIIFKLGLEFVWDLFQIQKIIDYVEELWKKVGNEFIKRFIIYMRVVFKLVKVVKVYEI